MAMKKTILFPYHPDIELFLEYRCCLKDIHIIGVCSYKEDLRVVTPLNNTLKSTGNFEELLKECDQIVLLENYRQYNIDKYYEILDKCIEEKKKVIIVPQLKEELELENYRGKYIVLENLPEVKMIDPERWKFFKREKFMIKTPVIAVLGMGKNCNKFENQILLKKILDEKGYNVVWLSSNPLGAYFGAYTIPYFLFDKKISFETKVFTFNEFLYHISSTMRPDVFVIGVPEGISEFEIHEYHHFAEYPLVIGSSVQVDSAVLCTYFANKLSERGIQEAIYYSGGRFGFPVEMISIGTSLFEVGQKGKGMTYSFLDKEYIDKYSVPTDIIGGNMKIAEVWNKASSKKAIEFMLEKLSCNTNII